MRRKKRFNVYSNATIKRCFCSINFCVICKGLCKSLSNSEYTKGYLAPNHPEAGELSKLYSYRKIKKNLHHFGHGSLNPKKKFALFCRRDRYFHKLNYYDEVTYHLRKELVNSDLQDQMEEFHLMKSLESAFRYDQDIPIKSK